MVAPRPIWHDGSLAMRPEKVVALLDAHTMMECVCNDKVAAVIGPQTARSAAFEQFGGIADIQPHPKRKLQQLVA